VACPWFLQGDDLVGEDVHEIMETDSTDGPDTLGMRGANVREERALIAGVKLADDVNDAIQWSCVEAHLLRVPASIDQGLHGHVAFPVHLAVGTVLARGDNPLLVTEVAVRETAHVLEEVAAANLALKTWRWWRRHIHHITANLPGGNGTSACSLLRENWLCRLLDDPHWMVLQVAQLFLYPLFLYLL